MHVAIQGFNQSKLLQLGLKIEHAIILDWLVYFAHSGKQKIICTKNKYEHYYWVSYKKVFEDFPTLHFHSNQKLNEMFKELSGEYSGNPNNYPIIKLIKNSPEGRMVAFALRENIITWLRELGGNEAMNSLIYNKPISIKKEHRQSHKINPNIKDIITDLLLIKKEDKTNLFRDKPIGDDFNYTQGLKYASEKIFALYEGRFSTHYKVLDSFVQKNKDHNIDKALEDIHSCKGNWNKIKILLVKAAKNYATWFNPENNPTNKDWLPKNIDAWLFDIHNSNALFLACINGSAYPLREVSAEKIYNSIPKEVRTLFKSYFNPDKMDGFAYWSKVKSLIKYYQQYRDELCNEDTNCLYWFGNNLISWLNEYLDWLRQFADPIYTTHLGTRCATWYAWLRKARIDHEISTNLPKY